MHEFSDIFEFLNFCGLEFYVESRFGRDDYVDVVDRIPIFDVFRCGLRCENEIWVIKNIPKYFRERVENLLLSHRLYALTQSIGTSKGLKESRASFHTLSPLSARSDRINPSFW